MTMNWNACGGMLLAALLAGCAAISSPERAEPAQPNPPPVNLSGYNTSFRQGYADGCASAGSRNPRRDESRYKTETDYMMGWNDGNSVCRRR